MRQFTHSIRIRLLALLSSLVILTSITMTPVSALSWSEETPLTTDPNDDWSPAILQASNGKIWIVWHTYRTINVELFYKTSADGGLSWSPDTRLTNNPSTDGTPAIMQNQNGAIWIFWASDRTGNYDIYCKTTQNNGLTWSPETPLTTDTGKDTCPAACQTSDGKIWLLWTSRRTGDDEVFCKTSPDNGATWTSDAPLTVDTGEDRYPSIVQAKDGTIWVAWTTDRSQSNFEIYYKTSPDNGQSWSDETRLTRDSSDDLFPSVAQARDMTIWILWDSDRIGSGADIQTELFYNVYDGSSWSGDTQLTTNETGDVQGEIAQGKTDLLVAWVSDRLGDYNIFFKHAFVPFHNVAIAEINPYPNKVYSGRPIKINVTVANEGTYHETFDLSIHRNGTLIATQAVTDLWPNESRTLTFNWDTTDIPAGCRYTISAIAAAVPGEHETTDNSLSNGAVHVKTKGDINGDDRVDMDDCTLMSANFGRPGKEYPDGDINGDEAINILDAVLIIIHWSETAP